MKNLLSLILLLSFTIKAQDVKIGTQTWSTKNLDVSKFRNGEAIPFAKTDAEWNSAGENMKPAWCYYENKTANGTKYGKLYNWYAVNDARGLAPTGYHIPSEEEWMTLSDNLGNEAGTKMKSTTGWNNPGNGTNTSGFAGLPGGFRNYNGSFFDIGTFGGWWSSSEGSTDSAWYRNLSSYYGSVFSYSNYKRNGLSVRCLRD